VEKTNKILLAINIVTFILWANDYKATERFYYLLQKVDLIVFGFMILVFSYHFMTGFFSKTDYSSGRSSTPLTSEEKRRLQQGENDYWYYKNQGETRYFR
jgi:hypothetical protein